MVKEFFVKNIVPRCKCVQNGSEGVSGKCNVLQKHNVRGYVLIEKYYHYPPLMSWSSRSVWYFATKKKCVDSSGFHNYILHKSYNFYYSYLLTYFLTSCQLCSHSATYQHFKEPEISSLCSQEPSTGPYPEPDWSSPYHPILCLCFNIAHPPMSW
jgi:hypothetical protein